MSKTIIAVRHFGLGGRESLETAVIAPTRFPFRKRSLPSLTDFAIPGQVATWEHSSFTTRFTRDIFLR